MPSPARPRAPTSTGGFVRTPLAHLLVYALDKALGGTFDLTAPDGATATLTVMRGRPSKVQVSGSPLYLGQVLVELGYLTREQLNSSLAELATAKKSLHGQLLIASGLLDETRLGEALRVQTLRKLGLLLRWSPESTFVFYAGIDALAGWGGESRPVDPAPAIWSAIRETADVDVANAALGRLSGAPLQLTKDASLDRFELRDEERRVFDLLLARPHTIDELAANAETLGPRGVRLLAYCLLTTRQIAPVRAAGEQHPPPSSSGVQAVTPGRRALDASTTAAAIARVALKKSNPGKNHPIVEENRISGVIDRRASLPPEGFPPQEDPRERQGGARNVLEATADFQKARLCLERNDLPGAESLARKAHLADPRQAEYLALLTWLESMKPEALGFEGTLVKIERLTEITQLDARCERAYFYRAMLHKRIGGSKDAYADFQKSLELDPASVDSQRELRLLEMRRSITGAEPAKPEEPPAAKPGILDRLFKKKED